MEKKSIISVFVGIGSYFALVFFLVFGINVFTIFFGIAFIPIQPFLSPDAGLGALPFVFFSFFIIIFSIPFGAWFAFRLAHIRLHLGYIFIGFLSGAVLAGVAKIVISSVSR